MTRWFTTMVCFVFARLNCASPLVRRSLLVMGARGVSVSHLPTHALGGVVPVTSTEQDNGWSVSGSGLPMQFTARLHSTQTHVHTHDQHLHIYHQSVSPGCPLEDGLQLRQLVVHAQQPARVQEHHSPAAPLVRCTPHLLQQLEQGFARVHRVQHDAWDRGTCSCVTYSESY